MSDKHLEWGLLKQLECPVCLDYMGSPIKMCQNGHNVCNSCRLRVSTCPTCKGQLIDVRNITLENIAATAVYPCKNRAAGCEETFALDDRSKHQSVCLYESRECPFRILSDTDCSWTGVLSDTVEHVRSEHCYGAIEDAGHFNVQLLNVSTGRSYHQAVFVLGELFYLVWQTGTEEFSFTVFHVGSKNKPESFKYGIKIGNSEEYISLTRKCQSFLQVGDKDLQPGKGVRLYYDTIQECLSESGDLSCEIEIGGEKLHGFVLEELQEFLPVFMVICNEER